MGEAAQLFSHFYKCLIFCFLIKKSVASVATASALSLKKVLKY
jgi:hypothetical protein